MTSKIDQNATTTRLQKFGRMTRDALFFVLLCWIIGINFGNGVANLLAQNFMWAGCSLAGTFGLLVGMARFIWYLK